MSLFDVAEPTTPEIEALAIGILKFGNQIGEALVSHHRQSREMLWNRGTKEDGTPFTTADAQAILDAMGDDAPLMFLLSGNLATFINTNFPGVLDAEELSSPIPYTIQADRDPQAVVLDPEVEYPGPESDAGDDGGTA